MVITSSLPAIGISAFWTADAIFITVFDGDLAHSCGSDSELGCQVGEFFAADSAAGDFLVTPSFGWAIANLVRHLCFIQAEEACLLLMGVWKACFSVPMVTISTARAPSSPVPNSVRRSA